MTAVLPYWRPIAGQLRVPGSWGDFGPLSHKSGACMKNRIVINYYSILCSIGACDDSFKLNAMMNASRSKVRAQLTMGVKVVSSGAT